MKDQFKRGNVFTSRSGLGYLRALEADGADDFTLTCS
jgi:hypothetical protein